jgi:uncharacterized protein (DUF1786 family)
MTFKWDVYEAIKKDGTMEKFLMIDIGAGTLDILYYDAKSSLQYKAVVKSPALTVAERAAALAGNLLVKGVEMGGGLISQVLIERARQAHVVMTASAAATLHHDPARVKSWGIEILDDDAAESYALHPEYSTLTLGDLELDRIERMVRDFGVPFSFDAVGICAQDHGVPPKGVSHLDFRNSVFRSRLDKSPFPAHLLFRADEIPPRFNRLRSIAVDAEKIPAKETYVMDSGMAAIVGASLDPQARSKERIMVLDIATSHTVGATIERGSLAGFFEYHTRDITLGRLEELMVDLGDGKLEHKRILEEGGHGAYVRKALGFQNLDIIVATGPKRRLLEGSGFAIHPGAPLGDNMMTGTAGLFEAIRTRHGISKIPAWSSSCSHGAKVTRSLS